MIDSEVRLGLWVCTLAIVMAAALLRGRTYAIMCTVYLSLLSAIWGSLLGAIDGWVQWCVLGFLAVAFAHRAQLIRPRLRPTWFNWLISVPGMWFSAATLLAFPWAVVATFDVEPVGWWLPFAVCLTTLPQTLRNPLSNVSLHVDGLDAGALARRAIQCHDTPRPLTIAQITDPHLGPLMSAARLHRTCERIVAHNPDLVFITGDLLTMQSQGDPDAVTHALAPLEHLQGRVFGCMGNHDYEAQDTVVTAMERIGATLLVDEYAVAQCPWGPVQIIGADFRWRHRDRHLQALFETIPDAPGMPRILMLHDPGAFKYVPNGAADLTLSGHTHGGQLGLLSLGSPWTILRAFSNVPDHGHWAQGKNRLYVHRGTGHYGFPIRLGVPGEESVLQLSFERLL